MEAKYILGIFVFVDESSKKAHDLFKTIVNINGIVYIFEQRSEYLL